MEKKKIPKGFLNNLKKLERDKTVGFKATFKPNGKENNSRNTKKE